MKQCAGSLLHYYVHNQISISELPCLEYCSVIRPYVTDNKGFIFMVYPQHYLYIGKAN